MELQNTPNIELTYLSMKDFEDLKSAMIATYTAMDNSHWGKTHIQKLIKIFPEGQILLKVDGKVAGCALSIILNDNKFDIDESHSFRQATGDYTFSTHDDDGDFLYGIEVFIKSEYRGMRLGRRLYDYRKELCQNLNLKGIVFGGRIPNYHKYQSEMTPVEYIEQVKMKFIHDPVLNFQLSNDFRAVRILHNYLEGDRESGEYAVLLRWDNIFYEKELLLLDTTKTDVRIGLIQWQMRPYTTVEDLMQQVEYFVDAVSGYRCDFALFPEFFNAPLMAQFNHISEPQAIRELAKFTPEIVKKFSELAISYNINIIAGSMPEVVDNVLYNVGYLLHRDGGLDRYEKLHVTPDEAKVWGLQGGKTLEAFDTDCGKVGVLICYDSEFPELSRLLADEGVKILFVPFLTDTQNGYSRVRNCAQARAIENECYVAIAGSVGNLPNVHNMDIQYAQSMVFTPCDFAFPANGIKAEATPNTEMILIADLDISMLVELNKHGSVRNLNDRRKDLFVLEKRK